MKQEQSTGDHKVVMATPVVQKIYLTFAIQNIQHF